MSTPGYEDIIRKNLRMTWDARLMTGQYRYYDGLVHYLSMLHLCGAFKIWKPEKEIPTRYQSQYRSIITGIESPATFSDSRAWYTLDGVRLKGKPTAKGAYINNGRKVVIN
jgi:oligosaccharide reducing-end xylanase